MAWFRRRSEPFVLVDVLEPSRTPAEDRAGQRAALRRIAAEAVILQDEAESVIAGIRARESLGSLAPRGGPVVRRFFAPRDRPPPRCGGPDNQRGPGSLAVTFHH